MNADGSIILVLIRKDIYVKSEKAIANIHFKFYLQSKKNRILTKKQWVLVVNTLDICSTGTNADV